MAKSDLYKISGHWDHYKDGMFVLGYSLFRESSVRLAAGVFFDAVKKSEQYRQALVDFHEGRDTAVYVENIKEIIDHPDKAPYYLNSIFDQLKDQSDYDAFYASLSSNAKFVFTIPAYVCGLLLFYSGMLIGKTIKLNRLGDIDRVELMPFGKGGRLFHWLRHASSPRTTNEYYIRRQNSSNTAFQGRFLHSSSRARRWNFLSSSSY